MVRYQPRCCGVRSARAEKRGSTAADSRVECINGWAKVCLGEYSASASWEWETADPLHGDSSEGAGSGPIFLSADRPGFKLGAGGGPARGRLRPAGAWSLSIQPE